MPVIKFRITPDMNKAARGRVFDSWEIRKRLAQAFPLLVNENPLIDPIGRIQHFDSGECSIEINMAGLPALTDTQKDSIRARIQAWSEFVRFEVDSA